MGAKRAGGFRVDLRPVNQTDFREYMGRAHDLTAIGCTITCSSGPLFTDAFELRLYLPGTDWPLAVEHADVTWSRWDTVTVEFRDEQAASILASYLESRESEAA